MPCTTGMYPCNQSVGNNASPGGSRVRDGLGEPVHVACAQFHPSFPAQERTTQCGTVTRTTRFRKCIQSRVLNKCVVNAPFPRVRSGSEQTETELPSACPDIAVVATTITIANFIGSVFMPSASIVGVMRSTCAPVHERTLTAAQATRPHDLTTISILGAASGRPDIYLHGCPTESTGLCCGRRRKG